MTSEQKIRLKKIIKYVLALLSIGVIYFIYVKMTGKGIPCLIKLVTKKYCPGCGITRMFMSLSEGDIRAALGYNMLIMVLMPFGAFFGIRHAVSYVKTGREGYDKAENIMLIITAVFVVLFWIMRNTNTFSWLAP